MKIKVYQRGDVILDTYLVEDIRSGAMGKVYIAGRKKWKMKVAIKAPNENEIPLKGLYKCATVKQRFSGELQRIIFPWTDREAGFYAKDNP